METIKLLTAMGHLVPDSWEEKTGKVRIYLLVAMESIEPEEFQVSDWELDCDVVVNNFGNHHYTTIGKFGSEYYALLIEDKQIAQI